MFPTLTSRTWGKGKTPERDLGSALITKVIKYIADTQLTSLRSVSQVSNNILTLARSSWAFLSLNIARLQLAKTHFELVFFSNIWQTHQTKNNPADTQLNQNVSARYTNRSKILIPIVHVQSKGLVLWWVG